MQAAELASDLIRIGCNTAPRYTLTYVCCTFTVGLHLTIESGLRVETATKYMISVF